MLSRILAEEEVGRAARVVWRQATPASVPLDASSGELTALHARVAELERELERRVREAYQTGRREGEAAGRAAETTQVQSVLERLARSIAELTETRTRLLRQAEGELVKLSIEIARRVLHREVAVDPEALHGLVRVAVEKLEGQEVQRVRVHPDHESITRDALAQAGRGLKIEVVADPALQPGDAVFESNAGRLDASIDRQLREIEQGLADRLERP